MPSGVVRRTISQLEQVSVSDAAGDRLQGAVHRVFQPGRGAGPAARHLALSPLHPVLVQLPVGAFFSAAVLDALPGQDRARPR